MTGWFIAVLAAIAAASYGIARLRATRRPRRTPQQTHVRHVGRLQWLFREAEGDASLAQAADELAIRVEPPLAGKYIAGIVVWLERQYYCPRAEDASYDGSGYFQGGLVYPCGHEREGNPVEKEDRLFLAPHIRQKIRRLGRVFRAQTIDYVAADEGDRVEIVFERPKTVVQDPDQFLADLAGLMETWKEQPTVRR